MSPRKINQVTTVLLLAGFAAAVVVFCTASDPDDAVQRQIEGSKRYVRDMRVLGGRANLAAAEFAEWFGDLWHGRQLAGTLIVVTVGVTLIFRFMASLPSDVPTGPRDGKTPPAGPA